MVLDAHIIDGQAGNGLQGLPLAATARILSLRPTQFAIGWREVAAKRKKIEELARYVSAVPERSFPVVLGPHGNIYLLDRHHYAVALCQTGVDRFRIEVVDDLSDLDTGLFWKALVRRRWTHPYDALGMRRAFESIPLNVLALEDDPFRSLAGALRRFGLYAKTGIRYADFAWADFLRHRIERGRIDHDFDAALNDAVSLVCTDPQARRLPGWRGFTKTPLATPHPAKAVEPDPC